VDEFKPLVVGATGRTGREVVRAALASGRQVVAAVRSAEKAAEVFNKAFMDEALGGTSSVMFSSSSATFNGGPAAGGKTWSGMDVRGKRSHSSTSHLNRSPQPLTLKPKP
jgi:NAD(P)-dependent dehydrogenase (short-subunit alcohol dehydrogenase family)